MTRAKRNVLDVFLRNIANVVGDIGDIVSAVGDTVTAAVGDVAGLNSDTQTQTAASNTASLQIGNHQYHTDTTPQTGTTGSASQMGPTDTNTDTAVQTGTTGSASQTGTTGSASSQATGSASSTGTVSSDSGSVSNIGTGSTPTGTGTSGTQTGTTSVLSPTSHTALNGDTTFVLPATSTTASDTSSLTSTMASDTCSPTSTSATGFSFSLPSITLPTISIPSISILSITIPSSTPTDTSATSNNATTDLSPTSTTDISSPTLASDSTTGLLATSTTDTSSPTSASDSNTVLLPMSTLTRLRRLRPFFHWALNFAANFVAIDFAAIPNLELAHRRLSDPTDAAGIRPDGREFDHYSVGGQHFYFAEYSLRGFQCDRLDDSHFDFDARTDQMSQRRNIMAADCFIEKSTQPLSAIHPALPSPFPLPRSSLFFHTPHLPDYCTLLADTPCLRLLQELPAEMIPGWKSAIWASIQVALTKRWTVWTSWIGIKIVFLYTWMYFEPKYIYVMNIGFPFFNILHFYASCNGIMSVVGNVRSTDSKSFKTGPLKPRFRWTGLAASHMIGQESTPNVDSLASIYNHSCSDHREIVLRIAKLTLFRLDPPPTTITWQNTPKFRILHKGASAEPSGIFWSSSLA
ncbi:hypothetical protein BT96DRAFT_1025001 [Gymnopus androsaceus JB14]|uniref:Uncharacterized protein n=1 Tax=Gymnopus androsaceus JB14 TaxID=1447944 RepID=A0A6A4GVP7_9AGAR|nr:hypothetical protein BT96DRAFT_1025001 [Gymnopus androsaceus JB14]